MSTYNQHLKSKKHQSKKAKFEMKQQILKMQEAQDADGDNFGFEVIGNVNFKKTSIPVEKVLTIDSTSGCLFSDTKSDSFEENLNFMFKNYGFFILEEKSCIDKEGLIKHLAQVVHNEKKCLYCGKRPYPPPSYKF